MAPAAPGLLAVTGSAFRPVQQTAYMIGAGQAGTGARSSTDSCVKPDGSSTSSNNETTTNNEHSIGQYPYHVSVRRGLENGEGQGGHVPGAYLGGLPLDPPLG